MGMTYRVDALKPTVTIKKYFDSKGHEPNAVADTIIDDMVFDREDAFRRWCGFPPWLPGKKGFAFRIETRHLQNARAVLQGLLDLVAKMPFTMDGPAQFDCKWNEQTGEYEDVYSGSQENVAILKAINEVLSRNYHFGYFPWEERATIVGSGVKVMIAALDGAIEFMESNPDRIVIGLYY